MTKTNPTPISKTAIDSLHAKLSAIEAGWLHSNINDTRCNHPMHIYTNLLQKLHPDGPKRRQTPLVNAGYAARMTVMTYVLHQWIDTVVSIASRQPTETQESDSIQCINVVMVGCGMDALGVWSKHLVKHSLENVLDDDTKVQHLLRVNVCEVDSWDNCILKKQSLLDSGLLSSDSMEDDENCQCVMDDEQNRNYHIHLRGRINLGMPDYLENKNDYTLVSLDLRDTQDNQSILSQAVRNTSLDTTQPTIVISELVLAYLGYEGANAVMSSVSNIINGNAFSMFTCLEPIFPTDDEQNNISGRCVSVQEAYARDYSQQFLGKLRREHNGSNSQNTSWLHPLGSNKQTLQQRLKSCSLSNSYCATLGECLLCTVRILRGTDFSFHKHMEPIGPKFMCAKEPFDEHAALSLNLSCYCVVCSFHASIENNKPPSWKELVCPWAAHHSNDDAAVTIRPISTTAEDVHVHDLYGRLYLHLYHEYPAIRKMVKSALKGDLSIDNCRENHLTSTIRDKFIDQSGDFWVATLNSRHDTKEEQRNPIVVGCIGVKRRSNKNTEYEIHRLAVDDSYRRLGVGKELIRVVEGFLRSKGASMSHAVTPSCLVAANKLYESFGYSLDNSKCFMAGALRMNVYLKNICSAQSPSTG